MQIIAMGCITGYKCVIRLSLLAELFVIANIITFKQLLQ